MHYTASQKSCQLLGQLPITQSSFTCLSLVYLLLFYHLSIFFYSITCLSYLLEILHIAIFPIAVAEATTDKYIGNIAYRNISNVFCHIFPMYFVSSLFGYSAPNHQKHEPGAVTHAGLHPFTTDTHRGI